MTVQRRKSLSLSTRFAVLQAGGFRCHYCGRRPPEAVLQVDHVIPLAAGGSSARDNLVASCTACNNGKGATVLPGRDPNRFTWEVVSDPANQPAPDPRRRPYQRCIGEFHAGPLIECSYPIDPPARALCCEICKSIIAFRYLEERETAEGQWAGPG